MADEKLSELNSDQLYFASVFAGFMKLCGYEASLHRITPELINAAYAPYVAKDENGNPKRFFHGVDHVTTIRPMLEGEGYTPYQNLRAFMERNAGKIIAGWEETKRILGKQYIAQLNKVPNSQDAIEHATLDFAALLHDTVMHTDGEINPATMELIKNSGMIEERETGFFWNNKNFSVTRLFLDKLAEVGGREVMSLMPPFKLPPVREQNEVWSAMAAEAALDALGIKNDSIKLKVVATIIGTLPFQSPAFREYFDEALKACANSNDMRLHDDALDYIRKFTNKADIAAFGNPLLAGNYDILTGTGQIDRETYPSLRNDETITGMDKAEIGTANFYRHLLHELDNNKLEIYRPLYAEEDVSEFNRHAKDHINAGIMLEDARVVAGFLTDAIQIGAGIDKDELRPQAALHMKTPTYGTYFTPDISSVQKLVQGFASAPGDAYPLFVTPIARGLPGDEYASDLLAKTDHHDLAAAAQVIYERIKTAKELKQDPKSYLRENAGEVLADIQRHIDGDAVSLITRKMAENINISGDHVNAEKLFATIRPADAVGRFGYKGYGHEEPPTHTGPMRGD